MCVWHVGDGLGALGEMLGKGLVFKRVHCLLPSFLKAYTMAICVVNAKAQKMKIVEFAISIDQDEAFYNELLHMGLHPLLSGL